MKIEIEHDEQGNIRTISIPVTGSKAETHLKPAPGWTVTAVESPVEIRDPRADAHRLGDIKQKFQLKGSVLVPRS